MKFPDTLKYYRKLRGYSVADIAEELNLTRQAYFLIEQGTTKKINIDTLYKLAKLYRIKVGELVPENGKKGTRIKRG
jgi:transcriptional regulator with XRE-family HTH domain